MIRVVLGLGIRVSLLSEVGCLGVMGSDSAYVVIVLLF